jgi:hypothetical protein
MRAPRPFALALLALALCGCTRYEYEHELWLKADGTGSLQVTGRPALWAAFKGVGRPEDPEKTISQEALRRLFETSGLRVRRVLRGVPGAHTTSLRRTLGTSTRSEARLPSQISRWTCGATASACASPVAGRLHSRRLARGSPTAPD